MGPGNPDPGPDGAVSPAWMHLTSRSGQKTGSADTAASFNTQRTRSTSKCLPQHGPSYMAVMLNMTDFFQSVSPSPRRSLSAFPCIITPLRSHSPHVISGTLVALFLFCTTYATFVRSAACELSVFLAHGIKCGSTRDGRPLLCYQQAN